MVQDMIQTELDLVAPWPKGILEQRKGLGRLAPHLTTRHLFDLLVCTSQYQPQSGGCEKPLVSLLSGLH